MVLREAVGIAVCCVLFLGASALARHVALPVPAGILGTVTLAALLGARVLPRDLVMPGGDRLLRYLVLFFVPAAVLVMRQRALLWSALLPFVAVVVVAAVVGLVVAGRVAHLLERPR